MGKGSFKRRIYFYIWPGSSPIWGWLPGGRAPVSPDLRTPETSRLDMGFCGLHVIRISNGKSGSQHSGPCSPRPQPLRPCRCSLGMLQPEVKNEILTAAALLKIESLFIFMSMKPFSCWCCCYEWKSQAGRGRTALVTSQMSSSICRGSNRAQ